MLLGFQMTKKPQTSVVQAFPIKQLISRIRFAFPGKTRPKRSGWSEWGKCLYAREPTPLGFRADRFVL